MGTRVGNLRDMIRRISFEEHTEEMMVKGVTKYMRNDKGESLMLLE